MEPIPYGDHTFEPMFEGDLVVAQRVDVAMKTIYPNFPAGFFAFSDEHEPDIELAPALREVAAQFARAADAPIADLAEPHIDAHLGFLKRILAVVEDGASALLNTPGKSLHVNSGARGYFPIRLLNSGSSTVRRAGSISIGPSAPSGIASGAVSIRTASGRGRPVRHPAAGAALAQLPGGAARSGDLFPRQPQAPAESAIHRADFWSG